MGLSFHYSGRFNPSASVKEMIAEVIDICKLYNWKHFVFDTDFPVTGFTRSYNENIYGICFTPPGCETISLAFLSNGKMSSAVNLKFYGHSKRKDYQKYLYMLSVKTQYAGIEIHALVINFLRYLSEKYFNNFKVIDEGKYWETGDMEVLRNQFRIYERLIDNFCLGLQTFPVEKGETMDDYFLRVIKHVQSREEEK